MNGFTKSEKGLYRVSQILIMLTVLSAPLIWGTIGGIAMFILGTMTACNHMQDARIPQAVGNVVAFCETVFALLITGLLFWFVSSLPGGMSHYVLFVIFVAFVAFEALKVILMIEYVSLTKEIELERASAQQRAGDVMIEF